MSVRERTWISPDGTRKAAYVADYVSEDGRRHIKTFKRCRDAKAYAATMDGRRADVRQRQDAALRQEHLLRAQIAAMVAALRAVGVEVLRIDIALDGTYRVILGKEQQEEQANDQT